MVIVTNLLNFFAHYSSTLPSFLCDYVLFRRHINLLFNDSLLYRFLYIM